MKKVVVIMTAMMLFSVGSFATKSAKSVNISSNEAKRVAGVITFTDPCGHTWKITATCNSCTTISQFGDALDQWILDHSDKKGCL
ncbi:MAG: hypothetical protein QM541_09250 [Flavobacterium sp.]|nr:hypothetical protein [Flavobacterium sp.]